VNLQEKTTEQIARAWERMNEDIIALRDKQASLARELERRMGEDEALACEGFNIQKKQSNWVYREDSMTAHLKELLTPEEWDSLKKVIPEKRDWDGRKIYSIGRKYKGRVQEAIDKSRYALNYRIEIKPTGQAAEKPPYFQLKEDK